MDKSFTIKSGERFVPPFHSSTIWHHAVQSPDFKEALNAHNAKLVNVRMQSLNKELYGVLEFSDVYEECQTTASARSYYITIPDKYIDDAQGGRISVVYEYYSCSRGSDIPTWILWLSDAPF
jgi:hypothetical protein